MSTQGSMLSFDGNVYQIVDSDGTILGAFLDEKIANDFNTRFTTPPRPTVVKIGLSGSYGEALFHHWKLAEDIEQAERDCGQPKGSLADMSYQIIMGLNADRPTDRSYAEDMIKTFVDVWTAEPEELSEEEIKALEEQAQASVQKPVFDFPVEELPREQYPFIAMFIKPDNAVDVGNLGIPSFANDEVLSYYFDNWEDAKAAADAHDGTAYYPVFTTGSDWAFFNGAGAMQVYSLRGGREFNTRVAAAIIANTDPEKCIEWHIKEPIAGTIVTSPEGKQWNEVIPLPEDFVRLLRDAGFQEVDESYMPGNSMFPGGVPYWATTFDEMQKSQANSLTDGTADSEMEDPQTDGDDGDDEDEYDLSSDPSQWAFDCKHNGDDSISVFVRSKEMRDYDQHSEEFIGHLMFPLGLDEATECDWVLYEWDSTDEEECEAKVQELTAKLVSLGFEKLPENWMDTWYDE